MELVVKATNTERTTFSLPHKCTTTFAAASNGSSHIASNHFFSRGLLSRRLLATLFRRRLRCSSGHRQWPSSWGHRWCLWHGRTASLHANDQTLTCQNQTCRSTSQADRRKRFNVPKANMPKHAERRNMPEGPHLCMQMTKLKHAKIKHAEARRRPTEESASTCQKQTCRSTRKEETCRKDRIFACKWPNLNMPKSNMPKHVAGRQKKALQRAKSKHAEARGKKKHAGRTASLHANDQT